MDPAALSKPFVEGEIQAVTEGSNAQKRVRKDKPDGERPTKRVKVKESDSVIKNSGPDIEKLNGEAKGTPKKRGRPFKIKLEGEGLVRDIKPKDPVARKGRPPKVKIEGQSSKLKESPTKKGKASKDKKNGLVSIPKWRLVQTLPTSVAATAGNVPESTQKPRIWFSSRDELLSTLPELASSKCFNGLSWELYETPILLLDETNTAFQVTRDDADPRSIDLVTTRVFVRPTTIPQKKQEPLPEANPGVYLAEMEPRMYRIIPETFHPPIMDPAIKPARKYASFKINKKTPIPGTASVPARINFSAPLPTYSSSANDDRPPVPPFICPETHRTVKAEIQTSLMTSLFAPIQQSGNILHADVPGNFVEVYNSRLTVPSISYNLPKKFGGLVTQFQQYPLYFPKEDQLVEESNIQSHPKQKMKNAFRDHQVIQIEDTLDDFSQPEANVSTTSGLNLDSDNATGHLMPDSIPTAIAADIRGRVTSEGSPSGNKIDFRSKDKCSDNPIPKIEPVEPVFVGVVGDQVQDVNQTLEGPQDDQELVTTLPQEPNQPLEAPKRDQELVATPLPQEIQTIIDAYLFGRPLTLIASHRHLFSRWSMLLPKDIGYAMMGYFKVIGIQETRVDPTSPAGETNGLKSLSGQLQWLFRLQWRPGGEEYIMPKSDPQTLEYPWWAPVSDMKNDIVSPEAVDALEQETESTTNATDKTQDPEDEFPTTDRYRQARLSHPEYVFRHDHYRLLYESLLPTSLLAPFGPLVLDGAFPRGWFCEDCGRVNYQTALRHRKCTSPSCKDKPPSAEPYALTLFSMRDPQDRLPISHPYNTCPSWVETKVLMHEDGVKTISYLLNKNGSSCIAHIFTGNVPDLQKYADILLKQLQLQVELKRPLNDNSPYFIYSAKSPKRIENPIENLWPNVPNCMNDAKATIYSRARTFSGLQETRISINRLTLLAWITSGVRKGPEILRAKEKCVVIASFGCEVILTLLPRSMELPAVQKAFNDKELREPAGDMSEPVDTVLPVITQQETMDSSKIRPPIKAEKSAFVLVLVHGDCIVLDGDDFEYSIKRDGTSFPLHLASLDCISRKNIVVFKVTKYIRTNYLGPLWDLFVIFRFLRTSIAFL